MSKGTNIEAWRGPGAWRVPGRVLGHLERLHHGFAFVVGRGCILSAKRGQYGLNGGFKMEHKIAEKSLPTSMQKTDAAWTLADPLNVTRKEKGNGQRPSISTEYQYTGSGKVRMGKNSHTPTHTHTHHIAQSAVAEIYIILYMYTFIYDFAYYICVKSLKSVAPVLP